jgi:hypothetical protein
MKIAFIGAPERLLFFRCRKSIIVETFYNLITVNNFTDYTESKSKSSLFEIHGICYHKPVGLDLCALLLVISSGKGIFKKKEKDRTNMLMCPRACIWYKLKGI